MCFFYKIPILCHNFIKKYNRYQATSWEYLLPFEALYCFFWWQYPSAFYIFFPFWGFCLILRDFKHHHVANNFLVPVKHTET